MTDACSERLFSYGTLQQEAVQLANFARRLQGCPDAVIGYKLSSVKVTDPEAVAESGLEVHKILSPSNNPKETVDGVVFAITPEELRVADEYETDAYKHVRVRLKSGLGAWVCASAETG
jgi:Gamma-glutamyl cyclotransferase, AIG2-like